MNAYKITKMIILFNYEYKLSSLYDIVYRRYQKF